MDEVKKEIFGSRNSILEPLLKVNNIEYSSDIWIVTCRNSINNNKKTRYLLIVEGNYDQKYKHLLGVLNPNVTAINVIFNEKDKCISVKNIRNNKSGTLSYNRFKDRIIELTDCKYIYSFASGSNKSSPLSRYFRENMGKGFSFTDLDFYIINKKLFLEEKGFIKNGVGYIGLGQCLSFKEVIEDVFPNLKLWIICVHNNDFYISNLTDLNCWKSEDIQNWGKMVPFTLKEISKESIIKLLK